MKKHRLKNVRGRKVGLKLCSFLSQCLFLGMREPGQGAATGQQQEM